ncbi:MAG: HAD-IB family hydrolase [Acidimicrobiales bacterium]|nr:HAD-IB family hydrolase [Acidimicrobiales bacterium]
MEAAFFDLDKTVIAKASMVAFGRPFQRAGLLSRWLVVRALYGQLVYLYLGADEARMAKMREAVLRVTKGWDQQVISDLVRETLAEVIDPIVYGEALDLIRDHRAAGRRVYIISASPEEIVQPLTEYLGADQAIATRAAIDDEGRYSGDVEFYSYGPFKAEAMEAEAERLGIDLAASFAYSDSATDIPMLEAVGHPVAVNPDRALARYAEEQGWETAHFVRQVELKRRRPVPTTAAAVSGGVVMAVAGGVVWWWLHRPTRGAGRRPAPTTAQRLAAGAAGALAARSTAPKGRPRAKVGATRSRGSSSPRGRRGR